MESCRDPRSASTKRQQGQRHWRGQKQPPQVQALPQAARCSGAGAGPGCNPDSLNPQAQ